HHDVDREIAARREPAVRPRERERSTRLAREHEMDHRERCSAHVAYVGEASSCLRPCSANREVRLREAQLAVPWILAAPPLQHGATARTEPEAPPQHGMLGQSFAMDAARPSTPLEL